ncbi:CorA family divalent cation transporter [Vibrio hyugaensis]|uniref:CorA family divalent cation transporter n=1 Tax=Vibrio hyugaensis TaxID=1534743 RepID=UPI0005EDB122|nr:CorA family divalent cation transporter [Vibrio hyugaensis]
MDFLIEHWDFSANKPTQVTDVQSQIKANHWYHCERTHPDIRNWLENNNVPLSTIDQLLTNETRPSFHSLGNDNFMLILRGINMNENTAPEDMLSVRILYFQGALISTRKVPSRAISDIRQSLSENKGPQDIAQLLNKIIEGLNGKIDYYLDSIEDKLQQFDVNDESTYQHISVQKALLSVKRFIRPQQYAIKNLLESDSPLVSSNLHQYRFTYNNIVRINETIDFYLGELTLIQEEIRLLRDEKNNKNSYLFTLVATIFLPTSFLTGLLGINIGGMPGVDSPHAFTWFCIALFAIFIFEWLLFKRLGLTTKS